MNVSVVAPYIGTQNTGVTADQNFITTSDVFYDALFIGSSTTNNGTGLNPTMYAFIMDAYSHGKAIGALGSSGMSILKALGIAGMPGIYTGSTESVTQSIMKALMGPVRFPQRFPTDDVAMICGSGYA